MNMYEMLGSKVRRRIIRVLKTGGHTNVMNLVRKVNSTYNQTVQHLAVLEKEGIVSEQRFGRVRMIKLERESPKTRLLLDALNILDKEVALNQKAASIINEPNRKAGGQKSYTQIGGS